ncbi:MAG: hypothetical protein ACRDNW_27580, partial [Trebonia sp.]
MQADGSVGRPALSPGAFLPSLPAVVLRDGYLVSEESRRAGSGVRDQRFLLRQFQAEFVLEELGEALLYLLGFRFRPGEPDQVVIGLCRGPGYADRAAGWPAWRAGRRSASGITRWSCR